MLKIKLDDGHRIVADSNCYTLQRVSIAKEGEKKGDEVYSPIGYHGTLESALKAYKELRIRHSDATTIQEVLEVVREIDLKIENMLGGSK